MYKNQRRYCQRKPASYKRNKKIVYYLFIIICENKSNILLKIMFIITIEKLDELNYYLIIIT